ncbi:MAG TPA: glutathione S-transferase family protein [Candidatus Binatia bacterium]|jgi:glutathione S-transferase
MRLYEFGPTRSIRARWTLQELGVDFESVVVDLMKGEHQRPEFLRINPAGKLPVLVDDDTIVTESVAIVQYLAAKYPEKAFLPRDVAERAQLDRWMLFTVTELEQPLWRMARHTRLYPEDRRLPGDVTIAREEFGQMAAVLARHLREREFVVGNRVSVADFVVAYTLDWANEQKLLGEHPGLVTYMERMYARPRAPMRIVQAFAAIAA